MIAISSETRRTMIAKGGTETYTDNCYSCTDCTYWREIEPHEITVTVDVHEEPAQEQDEPNTDERSVTWERPHRRLATVTTSRDRPRQLESSFG